MKRKLWFGSLLRINIRAVISLIPFILCLHCSKEDSNPLMPYTGTVTDIDGNVYQTIKIGDQWWMAENLRVTRYRNGDSIPNVTEDTSWSCMTAGAYCNYDNSTEIMNTYGCLYNGYIVNDLRNIAPEGWHVPGDAEWQTLIDYLGGNGIAGGKLKESGTIHWQSPNIGAINESGFSALPGGQCDDKGYFLALESYAFFWSSTDYTLNYAWSRLLSFDTSEIIRYYYGKRRGFSIRCIKD
jgi:uncharacterized protein (TIGR02145 family)